MRGSTGTSMQSIEYRKKRNYGRKKLVECKDCMFLSLNLGGIDANGRKMSVSQYPYKCNRKNMGRQYTTKIPCKLFKRIINDSRKEV